MDDEYVLTVPSRYDQIRTITEFVIAAGKEAGLGKDALFHLELCCDEASTNIIEHAYGGEDKGNITVRCQLSEQAFTVRLCDNGRTFNPDDVPLPPTVDKDTDSQTVLRDFLDSQQVGGLGIHFMRRLMDDVRYSFDSEQGNRLTLVKYLPAQPNESGPSAPE